MTEKRRQSLADRLSVDPSKVLDMTAARSAVSAVALLNRALESSQLTQRELAQRLNVSESRVSQVLNGDGNVRMATLARFLRAAGFELTLDAMPAEVSTAPLVERERRRIGARTSVSTRVHVSRWVTDRITEDGVGPEEVVVFSRSDPKNLHDARRIGGAAESSEPSTGVATGSSVTYSLKVHADA